MLRLLPDQSPGDEEDDVDGVQPMGDVFPERVHNHHWFGGSPGQVVVLVT